MHWTVTNRIGKSFWNVLAFSFAVSLVSGVCVPGLAQLNTQKDAPFMSSNRSVVANMASPSRSAGKSSEAKSATGLSNLPAHAQGPISAALGKDDSVYWVHPKPEGFRGENPRHALLADFTRAGAEVRSHNLRWRLETRGYGYGKALHPLKTVAPKAKANRVEYRRNGVTEWYENGPLGLEQGFTLAHAPGKPNGQPLTVELALTGDLVAAPEPGGKGLELSRKDGEAALRYTGLKATDATGRELRSWLEVRGDRFLMRVDDKDARYPVVVDPWILQAELTASDGAANDNFGQSVAVSGNTAVVGVYKHTVGANQNQGVAYVFVESGGTWTQQAELTASDGGPFDTFGQSVSVSGSTVIVGAVGHTVGANQSQGAAYVFVESGGTWTQQAELIASDGASNDGFGSSVAVDGSTVVVGARGHNVQGAAYVFVESGGTWTQQAELIASDGAANDQFGISVAVSGTTAVVGSPWHKVGPYIQQGAAYVFAESGGTWSQQAELTASDGTQGDVFGWSVAVSDSTIVAGAPDKTFGSNTWQGAAYVFLESGGTWSQQAELIASDGKYNNRFGSSVAVSGSTAVVGAPDDYFNSGSAQGAAYVFVESGGTWSQQAVLTAPDGPANNYFGGSVAVSGGMIAAGATGHMVGSNYQQGAAYVFGSSGPLYTLSASPSNLFVGRGAQRSSTITITPANGFSGSVSFTPWGLPSGVTAAFNPNPATSTSMLTLTASATATTGTTTVLVTGTSGSLTQTTPLTLTVTQLTSVTVQPTSLGFVGQVINTTSAAKTVLLKNTGPATLYITDIAASANFAISSTTCQATLIAGKYCLVQVTFAPQQLGPLTGTLTFTEPNTVNSPQTVALSGTGFEPATLSPANAIYLRKKVGLTSPAKMFTLANHQSVDLAGIDISTTGDFAVSATMCGTGLSAHSECTISVTFTPTATGTRTGQLSVSDSASNSPQTSSLTGTGD